MAPVSLAELWVVGIIATFALSSLDGLVLAQQAPAEPVRGQQVIDRRKAEFDPIGLRTRSFMVFPTVSAKETYNTNIFATEADAIDDFITVLEGDISARSDFSRHALNLNGNIKAGLYATNDDENYVDLSVGADGRIDVHRDGNVKLNIGYSLGHEDRSSPDDAGGSEPTELTTLDLGGAASYSPNRFSIKADLSTSVIDYDDTQDGRGVTIDQDDRDRVETVLSVRAGFRFKAENEGFVETIFNQKTYDVELDDTGLNRDSWGYEVRVGTTIELTGLLEGEVYAGYLEQMPDDASLSSMGGITLGGGLDWHVTPLTTLTFDLARNVVETTQSSSPGFVQTNLDIGVQHELLRNFVLSGKLGLGIDDYTGNGRDDQRFDTSFNAKYLFNRNMFSEFEVGHRRRASNVDGSDFSESSMFLKLGLQY